MHEEFYPILQPYKYIRDFFILFFYFFLYNIPYIVLKTLFFPFSSTHTKNEIELKPFVEIIIGKN